MTIVQTSSYTDPDGTVYECSPKATISVAALKDTLFLAKGYETFDLANEYGERKLAQTGSLSS